MKPDKHNRHPLAENALHKLYNAITKLQTVEEAQKFMLDLCTPAELQAMADRWLVVDPIQKGHSYRHIYDHTGVSMTTIGRVARTLSIGSGGYQLIYNRLNRNDAE